MNCATDSLLSGDPRFLIPSLKQYSGTVRFPSFCKGYRHAPLEKAEVRVARSGHPLDPIGFVAQLVFPDSLVFPLLWEVFCLIMAGICSLLITSFTSCSGTSWTLRSPLFPQGFSTWVLAKHRGPLGALGAPFGPLDLMRDWFPQMCFFSIVSEGFLVY